MDDLPFNCELTWEGSSEADLAETLLGARDVTDFGLNARYLVPRKSTLLETLGALAGVDQFTPAGDKGVEYYAVLAIIFLTSAMPFSTVFVPRQYEKLADVILIDKKTLRRTVREKDLVGVLSTRVKLKEALAFLNDAKLLEPLGDGEYLIARRPVRKLKLFS